jgi:hypothetical protein
MKCFGPWKLKSEIKFQLEYMLMFVVLYSDTSSWGRSVNIVSNYGLDD